MCTPTIIDASVFGTVLNQSKSAELHSWLEQGGGILVYATDGGYWDELERSPRMLALMNAYRQANHARQIEPNAVKAAEESLQPVRTRSKGKDKPILALAKAANALVLCTGDEALKKDFVDPKVLPDVGPDQRAAYPIDADQQIQRRFLNEWRCENPQCA